MPKPSNYRPEQLLLGRYRLVRQLGTGLGGETWLAESSTGPVAVKVLPQSSDSDRAIRSLIGEAHILRSIRHSNVVGYRGIIDLPEEELALLILDYVPGGDLKDHIGRRGPYSATEGAQLGLQLIAALQALHGARVLHRDLKPSNVLVTSRPCELPLLQVADFGISRGISRGVAQATNVVLTPGFAAPEQYTSLQLTPAADIFALGPVLTFILTGNPPTATHRISS